MKKRHYQQSDHFFAVCAYGESRYLEQCINSLLRQTVKSNIFIATSTPNSFIDKIAKKYKLEVKINHGEAGLAGDWNFAYGAAEGSLVTLAHQDDVYNCAYTEKILEAINMCRQPLIAFTDYYELRAGEVVKKNQLLTIKRILLFPLKWRKLWRSRLVRRRILSLGSAICCPSVTMVKDNLPNKLFENNMESNIDWQAWEEISRQQGEFVYISNSLIWHRIHEESTTSDIIGKNKRREEDFRMFCKFWPRFIARCISRVYSNSEKSNRQIPG